MAEIREALSAAFEKAETTETPAPIAAEVSATPAPEPAAEVDTKAAETATETPAEKAARERDEKGRFAAKKAAEAKAEPVKAEAAKPVATATAAAPKFKPPQSWKPALRDVYGTLPESVQEEIDRREREIAQGLQETAPARKFREDFERTLSPYMPLLRAGGGDPLQTLQGWAQTFHTLQSGTAEQKAQLIANAIQSGQIPLDTINNYLDGRAAAPTQPQAMPAPEELEARVMQRIQQQQYAQQWQQFSAENEFANDVKPLMRTIIEARAHAGTPVKDYAEAYRLACQMHPEVSQALAKRQEAEKQKAEAAAAQAQNAAAAKARAASTSVRTQPGGAVSGGAPTGIRAALEKAMAKQGG